MGTADERHNTGRTSRGAFPSGKWERHLLIHARQFELASAAPDGWCPWDGNVFEGVPFSLPKRPENSARDALNRLHDKDYVVLRPEKRRAASAKRYRLTQKGRRIAKELINNNGKTPRMVADEQRAERMRNKWYRLYVQRHHELMQSRVTPNTVDSELTDFMHALESRLGKKPDVDDPDVVRRAAARHLVQLQVASSVDMLRTYADLEERYGDGAVDRAFSAVRTFPITIESAMSALQASLDATHTALPKALQRLNSYLDALTASFTDPAFVQALESKLQSARLDAEEHTSRDAELEDVDSTQFPESALDENPE